MSTSNLYLSIDMEVSQVIGGTPNHCSIETQPYELPRNLSIFLGVTSRSQLSSTKTAEESQKNHWTIFQLVKGEKWPPCPEWKPRSSSDVSWVKLDWKKHRRAAVPVVKLFINTLLASGKKNVKHPRSQRTSKWHLNFKIYKKNPNYLKCGIFSAQKIVPFCPSSHKRLS